MTNVFGTEHEHTTDKFLGFTRHTFEFPNGYGASVLTIERGGVSDFPPGMWEMAALKHGDVVTGILSGEDVDGLVGLSTDGVVKALTAIAELESDEEYGAACYAGSPERTLFDRLRLRFRAVERRVTGRA